MSSGTCRICLLPKSKISLVEKCETDLSAKHITFLDAYNDCTHLLADASDTLPQFLCSVCGKELQRFFKFLQRAKASDAKLRKVNIGARRTRAKSKALELGDLFQDEITADTVAFVESTESLRDPLEETDYEDESKRELDLYWTDAEAQLFPTSSFSDYDEEDNKPLKHFIGNKINKTERNPENNRKVSLQVYPQHFNVEKEEPEEEVYSLAEDLPDTVLSAEEQIFPQGRHKCHTCAKLYFTTTGLKAHLEVHQPKSFSHATKRKRVRGPNKKKRKVETEGTSLEAEHETDSRVTEVEVVVEARIKNERQPRKLKLPKPKKMFPCQVCGKHMISASKLRYHMVMHTGEKDYLCTMCPKAYSTIYALKHHIKTHTGDRPYECRFCGDRFLRPTTLKSHIRRHTGERPYGCDICGKRFIQHSSMTTHIKLNHMAKTIPCPHCDKKYARQTDLNTHLLSHTGDKPFSCKLCPSRFIRQANLNKHTNQHHSSERERCGEAKTLKGTKKANTKAILPINDEQKQLSFANAALSGSCDASISLEPRPITHLTSSRSPTLSVGSCSIKSIPILNSLFQQSNTVTDTIYTADTFEANSTEQHILRIVQHTKIVEATDKAGQQQQLLSATAPLVAQTSEEDLQRWNWPHGS